MVSILERIGNFFSPNQAEEEQVTENNTINQSPIQQPQISSPLMQPVQIQPPVQTPVLNSPLLPTTEIQDSFSSPILEPKEKEDRSIGSTAFLYDLLNPVNLVQKATALPRYLSKWITNIAYDLWDVDEEDRLTDSFIGNIPLVEPAFAVSAAIGNTLTNIWQSDVVKEIRGWTREAVKVDQEERDYSRSQYWFDSLVDLNKARLNSSFVDVANELKNRGIWTNREDPALVWLASAMDVISDKVDLSNESYIHSEWNGWYNWTLAALAWWSDNVLDAEAEITALETWQPLEDIVDRYKSRRTEFINKEIFNESIVSNLSNEEAAIIANAAATYKLDRDETTSDFIDYDNKKREKFYKDYYPDNFESKIDNYYKELNQAQEDINQWTKFLPKASVALAEYQNDTDKTYREKEAAYKNFNAAINAYATMKKENRWFESEIEWYIKEWGLPIWFLKQIEEWNKDFEKNFTRYLDNSAVNYFKWWITGNEAKTETDYQYIESIIIPDNESYTFMWNELTATDLQAVVNGNYTELNASYAARLVADHMTKEMRTITDFDWNELEIKLEQFGWWRGMQWLNYVNSQIKDIVLNKWKTSYKRAWYQALAWVSYWLWFVWQSIENTATTALKVPIVLNEETWIKSTLSVLGKSNELNYNPAWWSFGEGYDSIVNFVDEYWEAIVDIPVMRSPLWAAWIWTRALSLSRWGNRMKAVWGWKFWVLWSKVSSLWERMIKTSDNIKDWSIYRRARDYGWIKSFSKKTFLAKPTSKLNAVWNIDRTSIASSQWNAIWATFKELVDNLVQDRLIWNFIVGKTTSSYTDDDVFWDSVITVWIIPVTRLFTGILKGTQWLNKTRWQNKQLDLILKWLAGDVEARKTLFPKMLESFWIKEWVDFNISKAWEIVPTNVQSYDKIFDAHHLDTVAWNTFTKMSTTNPEKTEKAVIESLLQQDALESLRKADNVSRTWLSSRWYLDLLEKEWKSVVDWSAPSSVLAKYTEFNPNKLNVIKSLNSLTTVWKWDNMLTKIDWDTLKASLGLSPAQFDAGITEKTIELLTKEKWVDLKKYFSVSEIKDKDWVVSEVYKWWWEDSFEVWHSLASWTDIKQLFEWLPKKAQSDIKIVQKLLNDLDINIPC